MISILKIIIALLVFGLVILIHELGHFTMAKLNKVKVNEFSIGMGPVLFQKKKDDTAYSLRVIPMGGFVAMEGEDEESEDENSFNKKSPFQKIAIIAAGPIMNFILTIVIIALVFFFSGYTINTVGGIIPGSPAEKTHLQEGDKIIELGGIKIRRWEDIGKTVNSKSSEETLIIKYERNGDTFEEKIAITSIDGSKYIGISPGVVKYSLSSIPRAFSRTIDLSGQMLDFFGQLIRGKADFKYVSGPIGIIKQVGDSAKYGIPSLAMLTAIISLNLGIINLMPFPALDGGRILFSLIEVIRGKKLNEKIEMYINMAGMVMLIGLMIYVSYKDVLRIFNA